MVAAPSVWVTSQGFLARLLTNDGVGKMAAFEKEIDGVGLRKENLGKTTMQILISGKIGQAASSLRAVRPREWREQTVVHLAVLVAVAPDLFDGGMGFDRCGIVAIVAVVDSSNMRLDYGYDEEAKMTLRECSRPGIGISHYYMECGY